MRLEKAEAGPVRKRSFLLPLLTLLAAAFVLTSGMLGFLLGRNATRGTGELIDTIVLSPGQDLSGGLDEITHFLSGRVVYADGAPCAGATVQMKDSGKSDRTDERGKFFFSDIRSGEHVLEVLDDTGAILADTPVSLEFQRNGEVRADVTVSGAPSLAVPENTRMLELTFTVDPDGSRLKFHEEDGYVVTAAGEVVDFSGSMLRMESSSFSVMPGGDIVSSSGHVLVPSRSVVVSPLNEADSPSSESGGMVAGAVPQEGGSVLLNSGVSVEPGGIVVLPDQQEPIGPADNIILVDREEAEVLPELPEDYQPSSDSDAPDENDAVHPDELQTPEGETQTPEVTAPPLEEDSVDILPPADSGEAPADPPDDGSGPLPTVEPDLDPTVSPEPTPAPTPDPFGVSDLNTGASWTQQSLVDLFKNKTSGKELGEQDGVPVIAPGSSGYYEFQLKNDADYGVRFTLSISEQSFHLPILYSVRDLESNYLYEGGGRVGTDGSAVITDYILLPAKSQRQYRLGWEWQYEDWLSPWEDDIYDTDAALSEDRTYIVSMSVAAEQVYSSSNGQGDGTSYPGWTNY